MQLLFEVNVSRFLFLARALFHDSAASIAIDVDVIRFVRLNARITVIEIHVRSSVIVIVAFNKNTFVVLHSHKAYLLKRQIFFGFLGTTAIQTCKSLAVSLLDKGTD